MGELKENCFFRLQLKNSGTAERDQKQIFVRFLWRLIFNIICQNF